MVEQMPAPLTYAAQMRDRYRTLPETGAGNMDQANINVVPGLSLVPEIPQEPLTPQDTQIDTLSDGGYDLHIVEREVMDTYQDRHTPLAMNTIASLTGYNALKPSVVIQSGREGDFAINVSGKQLKEDVRSALDIVKVATLRDAGIAIKESFVETVGFEPKPSKKATEIESTLCGKLIIHISEKLGTTSIVDIVREIRKDHAELIMNPHFKAILTRFSVKPEVMKESFSQLDYRKALVEMAAFTEFDRFIERHGIDPEKLIGESEWARKLHF